MRSRYNPTFKHNVFLVFSHNRVFRRSTLIALRALLLRQYPVDYVDYEQVSNLTKRIKRYE